MSAMERLREMAERIHIDQAHPHPAHMVAGTDIFAMITAAAKPSYRYDGLSILTGIPVTLDEHLDPGEWRLLDQHGGILKLGYTGGDGLMYVIDVEAMGADPATGRPR